MVSSIEISAPNFRAIRSMPVRSGRTLKSGLLFRSGDLSEVTRTCVAELQRLGIRSVIDLRSERERQLHSYAWLPMIDAAPWGDPAADASTSIRALLERAETEAGDVSLAMQALYRDLPFSHAQSYATLFRRVAKGEVPILFGCSAGKDRTGMAAALLLWSLGVDFEDIAADYLLTNQSFDVLKAIAERKHGWSGPEALDGVLRAERSYLDAAIDAVVTGVGGIDAYVEQTLAITQAERAAIKQVLLD